jgi:hypothetical protein
MRRTEAVYIRWGNRAGEEIGGRERRRGRGFSSTCYAQQRLGSNNCGVNYTPLKPVISYFHHVGSHSEARRSIPVTYSNPVKDIKS